MTVWGLVMRVELRAWFVDIRSPICRHAALHDAQTLTFTRPDHQGYYLQSKSAREPLSRHGRRDLIVVPRAQTFARCSVSDRHHAMNHFVTGNQIYTA